jgi:hypothetical protein
MPSDTDLAPSTPARRAPRAPASAARALLRALDVLLEDGILDYSLDTEFECRRVFELTQAFAVAERIVPPHVSRMLGHPKKLPPLSVPEVYATVHLARHLCYWGTAGGAEGGPALAEVRSALTAAEAVLPIAPMLPHVVPTAASLTRMLAGGVPRAAPRRRSAR